MDDPNYGWGRYVSGEISAVTIPGQHTDLFAPASESLIAQALSTSIARYTCLAHPENACAGAGLKPAPTGN